MLVHPPCPPPSFDSYAVASASVLFYCLHRSLRHSLGLSVSVCLCLSVCLSVSLYLAHFLEFNLLVDITAEVRRESVLRLAVVVALARGGAVVISPDLLAFLAAASEQRDRHSTGWAPARSIANAGMGCHRGVTALHRCNLRWPIALSNHLPTVPADLWHSCRLVIHRPHRW